MSFVITKHSQFAVFRKIGIEIKLVLMNIMAIIVRGNSTLDVFSEVLGTND